VHSEFAGIVARQVVGLHAERPGRVRGLIEAGVGDELTMFKVTGALRVPTRTRRNSCEPGEIARGGGLTPVPVSVIVSGHGRRVVADVDRRDWPQAGNFGGEARRERATTGPGA